MTLTPHELENLILKYRSSAHMIANLRHNIISRNHSPIHDKATEELLLQSRNMIGEIMTMSRYFAHQANIQEKLRLKLLELGIPDES